MMYRARLAPRSSMTPSSDSTHSVVSSGSVSGSWLGRPSLMTGRLRSVATGVSFGDWVGGALVGLILPVQRCPRHADPATVVTSDTYLWVTSRTCDRK